jgi:hypothetical protein
MRNLIKKIGNAIKWELEQEVNSLKEQMFAKGELSPLNSTIQEWEDLKKPSKNLN